MYASNHRPILAEGVEAETFEELAEKALEIVGPARELEMVCGPISTGGTGNQIYNFQVMNSAVRGLEAGGVQIFNQLPYEFGLRRLLHKWEAAGNTGYCMPILTTFYATLFKERVITKGWFVPGWPSSIGASWEREQLLVMGCVHDLSHAEIQKFLAAEYPSEHVDLVMSLLPV